MSSRWENRRAKCREKRTDYANEEVICRPKRVHTMNIDPTGYQTRCLELSKICQVTRHGVVEGVEFDLRHELLDRTKWVMGTIGIHLDHCKIPHEPFCWYPWYGSFDGKALRRAAIKEAARIARIAQMRHKPVVNENAKTAFVNSYVKKRTPEHLLNVGDKLIIESVVDNPSGDEFNHPDDAKTRWAYLRIIRGDGSCEKVATPLRFEGITALLQRGVESNFFERLCHRICLHFGVKSLDEINLGVRRGADKMQEPKEQLADRAVSRAQQIKKRSFELRRVANSIPFEEPNYAEAASAWASINDGVLLGYLWAQVESESGAKLVARAARRRKSLESGAGVESGKTRRRIRAEWEAVVRRMVPDILDKHPSASQDDIVDKINERNKGTGIILPRRGSIKAVVSQISNGK